MLPSWGPGLLFFPKRSSRAIRKDTISASASAFGHPKEGTNSAASSRAPSKCRDHRPSSSARSPRITVSTLSSASLREKAARSIARRLIFGPDGTMLGKHRKLMPTAMERVIWGSGDGSTMPVVTTDLGKIGSVICWENYMPLLRTAMYAKGIELYCAITVDDRDTWVPTVTHIALEGRCFVLSACQFLRRSDLPADYPMDRIPAAQQALIRGGSCIIGPLGQVLAGPKYGEECILTADLDLADLPVPSSTSMLSVITPGPMCSVWRSTSNR